MRNCTKALRVRHAVVRFDRVPIEVESGKLFRSKDILDMEYCLRRPMHVARFEKMLQSDINGWLGEEIVRLGNEGIPPVLYIDCGVPDIEFFYAEVGRRAFDSLASHARGVALRFPSNGQAGDLEFVLSAGFVKTLADYCFSLEIG